MKKKLTVALLCAAAAVGVLALLVLVPSSPALIVDDYQELWFMQTGVDEWETPTGLSVTMYSVMIAVGAALAIALTVGLGKLRRQSAADGLGLALTSGLCALLCSHWLFCALRWGYIINDLWETPWYILQFWKGGYTMYGAILGGLLGALVYARAWKLPVGRAMDMIVPGMALLLVIGRAAECFTSQGMGTEVVDQALGMLPFGQADEWDPEVMHVRVYVYEALAAGAALIASLAVFLRGKSSAGRAAETGLTIISAAQVMLDSWRGDELIRFGFVRLNMIAAAVMLAALMALRVWRAVKAGGVTPWTVIRVVLLLLGAAAVLIVEFGLDGKMGITASNTLLYAIQTAAVVLMGATVLIDGKNRQTCE